MMKTLRKKFIVFAMSAVTILLLVLIGAISGFSWMVLNKQSDTILHTLTNADGIFKQMDFDRQPPLAPPLNMDLMRSVRFFMVQTSSDGTVTEIKTDRISSVSDRQAKKYAAQVNQKTGIIDGYKYEVKTIEKKRLIFFIDTAGQKNTFIMVLAVSSIIALGCWLVILAFAVLFSGRVVRPIIEGIEKQKQFITNAGHELKTPLTIIQSNNDAAMLIYGETKYGRNIRFQTQRLNMLMTNLLTLSKLDEEAKLPIEAVNISELICGMLDGYKDIFAQKKILLTSKISPCIIMQTHKATFSQMISILLDNAFKYTPEGGTIHFSVSYNGTSIKITEENTCELSCNTDPERFFERFYRGDSARTQTNPSSGYGIGLSAARAIAEAFDGSLTAEYTKSGTIQFVARF